MSNAKTDGRKPGAPMEFPLVSRFCSASGIGLTNGTPQRRRLLLVPEIPHPATLSSRVMVLTS